MTRFIPSEEIDAQQVRHWHFGNVKNNFNGFSAMPEMTADAVEESLPLEADTESAPPAVEHEAAPALEPVVEAVAPGFSEEEVEQMLAQARQEAFEQGQQQGQQQASQEWQAHMADYQNNLGRDTAQRLSEVLHGAQSAVQGLQQQMAPDLLQLACDIARQVVRQELRCNPQALQPVVSEALDMLGADTKPAVVRLHPDDFKQLEAHLRAALPNPKVEWLADASVAPGGCLVESQGAQVDGSLERRWQRAVAALGLVSTWYEGANHGN